MTEIEKLYSDLLDQLINIIDIDDLEIVEEIHEDFLNRLIDFLTK